MGHNLRIVSAIGSTLLVACLLFFVFGLLGNGLSWITLDHLFPTISGKTPNTNTNFSGNLLLVPLALAGGLVCGALVWDPRVSSKTEAFTAVAVFILLAGVSGFNFWSGDQLINVNGQMLIDFVLSVASLVIIGLLLRWKPSLMTAIAIQRVVLFLVTVFGFVLPLYYATNLLLMRLGYSGGLGELPDWMKFFAGVLGLAAALSPSLKALHKSLQSLANR